MDLNICTLVGLRYHTFCTHPPYPYKLFPWARHQPKISGKDGEELLKRWCNRGEACRGVDSIALGALDFDGL
jgi:hypothetical protein